MKKTIKQLNSLRLQQEYPLTGLVRDWFFRCEEISSGVYKAEGIDLWGRTVSVTGLDPESLIEQCVTNAKSITTSFEKAEKKLEPEEDELRGNWIVEDGVVTADVACRRIEWLTANWLEKQAVDDTEWNVLYRDPNDGRYWELTYPQSELHGGGPPALFHVSEETVESKYGKYRDT
jgi:hypothetical protein